MNANIVMLEKGKFQIFSYKLENFTFIFHWDLNTQFDLISVVNPDGDNDEDTKNDILDKLDGLEICDAFLNDNEKLLKVIKNIL